MGGERYKVKMYDGTDPDAPVSWWEGWPLTLAAIAFSGLHWGATIWAALSSLFS